MNDEARGQPPPIFGLASIAIGVLAIGTPTILASVPIIAALITALIGIGRKEAAPFLAWLGALWALFLVYAVVAT